MSFSQKLLNLLEAEAEQYKGKTDDQKQKASEEIVFSLCYLFCKLMFEAKKDDAPMLAMALIRQSFEALTKKPFHADFCGQFEELFKDEAQFQLTQSSKKQEEGFKVVTVSLIAKLLQFVLLFNKGDLTKTKGDIASLVDSIIKEVQQDPKFTEHHQSHSE